jgi:GT2 family glycosyltransferase
MIPVDAGVERYQRPVDQAASREVHAPSWANPTAIGKTRLIAGAPAAPKGCYDADIIILALERVEETLAAIASASGQTGVSAHIFVLDQGSCSKALERLAQTVQVRRDVTLLATERNLGVAGGRNLISGLGHGRVIVALDNDAEFDSPDTVARMVAALDAEPRLAAIGCRIVTYASGEDDLSSWGYPVGLLPRAGESFDAVTYVGAGHAILREAWQQAGGYDSKLFFCWEEFDFCLRAIALGWAIRYRGDIVIRHKVCAEQRVAWTAARWFYFVRNRLYIERKLDHGWFALLPRIAGYMLKGIRNGLPVQTLCAIRAAARMAPRATRPMPLPGLCYLARNDLAHRGSIWRRLVREVLCRINTPRDVASPVKR